MQQALDLGGLLVLGGDGMLLELLALFEDVVVLLAELEHQVNPVFLDEHTHDAVG